MPRPVKSKWFIVALVTIVLLVVIGVTANKSSKLNWLSNILSVPLKPVQGFLSSVGREIEDFFGYFQDIDVLREENEALKSEVEELRRKNREFAELKEKNDELRRALNLKAEFADYTIAGANIIAVEPGNWFSVFKVDVGERDGIHVDFPVVTGSRGLIGRVLDTDISTSNIQTIIDEESAVSGWIAKPGGGHAIVKGDLQLKEEGLCKLVYIPIEIDIEVGDIIETSGVGGIYPKGIEIGTVIEVRKTNSEFDRYAIIQPTADFKRLEEVFILKSEKYDETGSAEQ
ncbi:MAG: rod shape-determining protein MreC [Acetivibrionales bacterium]|nr:rod shape-determining protein MreC [Bacillota bacterium]NLP07179.1 rod shape-determining protein MreC [Clostridiaceae bacterium]